MDFEQFLILSARAIMRPRWGLAYIQQLLSIRDTRLHNQRIGEYEKYRTPLDKAIAKSTGGDLSQVQTIVSDVSLKDYYIEAHDPIHIAARCMGGSAETNLAIALYAICRLLRPQTVVETGVSYGISSAFILRALTENQQGHLYSIDLPAPRWGAESSIGISVLKRLRTRWTLTIDFSKHALPKLLAEIGTIDLFLSDSEHTYRNQRMEHTLAWKHLSPGGILIEDDIFSSDAFLELCQENDLQPLVVSRFLDNQNEVQGPFGILSKPRK